MNIGVQYILAAYALIVSVGHCDATINYDIVSIPGAYASAFTPKNTPLFAPTNAQDSSSGITTGVDLQKLALVTSVSPKSTAFGQHKSPVNPSVSLSPKNSSIRPRVSGPIAVKGNSGNLNKSYSSKK